MAFTLGFHIILASLGVALPAMMLIANYRGLRRDDPDALQARAALVEGGGGDVRGRRRDRDRPLLRVRAALAGVHRTLRRGVRRAVRDRGALLLPRGDLHRDLHLRLEAPLAVGPLLDGGAGRDRGPRRRVLGRGRELVDEPASGVLADDGRRHVGRAAEGDLQPGGALRGSAHDPGGVPRHRVPRGLHLRGRDAPRPARPHPSPGTPDPAHGRLHRDADPVRGRRHGRACDREGPADQVRRHGMRPDDVHRRDGVHLRQVHRRRREGRHRDPRVRLVPGRLEHQHAGDRARHRAARRSSAVQHHAALGLRHHGRHLHAADRSRALARHRLVAEEGLPAVALVPPRGGRLRGGLDRRARVRLDRDRGRTPAVDRLQRHAHRGRGHAGERRLGHLRRDRRRSTSRSV